MRAHGEAPPLLHRPPLLVALAALVCLLPLPGCAGESADGVSMSAGGGGAAFDRPWTGANEPAGGADAGDEVAALDLGFVDAAGDDGLPCGPGTRCAVHVAHDEQRALSVRAAFDGAPAADLVVKFGIEEDPGHLGFISALSAYTDAEGLATVDVEASRPETGVFSVRASLEGAATPPRFFDVVVTPDGSVPLAVAVSYSGEAALETLTVALHAAGGAACAAPHLLAASAPVYLSPPVPLDQTARILDVGAGGAYTALVTARDAGQVVRAQACVEGVSISPGQSLGLELELEDSAPAWSGDFKVVAGIDVAAAAAAAGWAETMEEVLGYVAFPEGLLLPMACLQPSTQPLCAGLFAEGADGLATPAGAALSELMASSIEALAADTAWAALRAGELDLASALPAAELHGTLHFGDEPAASGAWSEGAVTLALTKLTATWEAPGACPPAAAEAGYDAECDASLHLAELPTAAEASLLAHLAGPWELTAQVSALDLSHGEMLGLLLQRALLPHLVPEAGADSWLEWLLTITGGGATCLDSSKAGACCEPWIEALTEDAAPGAGALATLLGAHCHELLQVTAAWLDASLITGEEGASFALHEACPGYDDDGDLVIDRLGDADLPCHAILSVVTGAGDATDLPLDLRATRAGVSSAAKLE